MFFFSLIYFSFIFFTFFEQMKKLSSYSYTGARFKIAKYQHLELILREHKLTSTKIISNVTYSETKIGIELNKAKKNQMSLGHLPLTSKGRVGCSALSSPRSLGFFEFSILAFSIFDFDISIFGRRTEHLGCFSK